MSEGSATGDGELVARAANGSADAFRQLYRAYVRPVHRLAYRLVGNAADAEDVTQETFLAAWRKLAGFELAGESLLPWLATICRFQAANRLRRQQRDRRHLTAAPDDTLPATVVVEQQVVDADTVARILAEVATLGDLDREIFRLCAAEGWAYQAAADELGVGHGVVRNRLSRLRTRLRATAGTETS